MKDIRALYGFSNSSGQRVKENEKSVLMVLVIVWALLVVLAGCGADDVSLDVKPEKTNPEFWVKYEVED